MIEISPEHVTPQLTSLFAPDMPASLRCFAVLAGAENGLIMTDTPDRPSWGAVWESGDGTLYLGGALDAPVVSQIITFLRRNGDVLFGFMDGDPVQGLLPPHPGYVGTTLEFLDRPGDGSGLDPFLAPLPAGYEVRRMDADLLAQCIWYADTVRRYGSAEQFLSKGLGMCLLHNGVVASEAYAGPPTLGIRELGAVTREEYRRRGLATITCAHLIRTCEALGDRTYWNCATTNIASASVARKLGYQTEREYRLLAWFKADA
jgi:RimJ/RimL family protein N-acetyltransferase